MAGESSSNDTTTSLQITWADQSNINLFATSNQKYQNLEPAYQTKKRFIEEIDDLAMEAELLDEDEDTLL